MPGKRKGHPSPATVAVTVRLPIELVNQLDVWAGEHDATARAAAIVALVEIGLTPGGDRGAAAPLRARAAALAGEQIDRMADTTATAEERGNRKTRLTDGPSVFRDVRRDRPDRPVRNGEDG